MNFITRYHPIHDTLREFDRIFDLGFSRGGLCGQLQGQSQHSGVPATDFYEDGEHYYVKTELPGVKKADVTLAYEDDTLKLSASRQVKTGGNEQSVSYSRSVRVPDGVQRDGISASFEDGVLTVTLPKAEQAKPRQIAVK